MALSEVEGKGIFCFVKETWNQGTDEMWKPVNRGPDKTRIYGTNETKIQQTKEPSIWGFMEPSIARSTDPRKPGNEEPRK